MGRVSQRHHRTEIIWSEHDLTVCVTHNTSLAGGLLFQDELWGRAYVILHMCVRMHVCAFYLAVHEQPEGEGDVHAPVSEILLTVHSGGGVRRRESHERSSRDNEAVQSDELCLFFLSVLLQFCNTQTETAKHVRSFSASVHIPYVCVNGLWKVKPE